MPWQQLKTGFSERPTLSHQNLTDYSSSLAFAIACHERSGPQGHSIFIDLRNRVEERVEVKDKLDKKRVKANDEEQNIRADKNSKKAFEQLEKGNVRRLLTKFFGMMRVKLVTFVSGKEAMLQRRKRIEREQSDERKADEEIQAREGTEQRRRERASVQLRERERARLQKSDPAELIEKVKDMWVKHCSTIMSKELGKDKGEDDKRSRKEKNGEADELLVRGAGTRTCDIFDVCAVSFFRNVRGDAI